MAEIPRTSSRQRWTLALVCTTAFMLLLDVTVVSVARPDRCIDVDAVVVREGKNFKGRLLEILLATGGKRVLGSALAKTVKAIESRNYQPRQAQS